ncbi:MAG: hypothetical protein ABSA67_04330 [Candidatus Brocadiia bacterium]|jgi:hypothetical protein
MKQFTRRFSSFLFLALAFCGCRTASPPAPLNEIVQELPSQILLRLQVIALREAVNPADEAPFPALGFQFAGDRVVPVEKPDTIAGVELTTPQLARWVQNLDKAGATLYAAPGFTVGPDLPASSLYSAEKQYQANWRVDTNGISMQNATVTPESKFSVRPELVPGTRDLLTNVGIEISTADLDSFVLVDHFVAKDQKPVPLALLLPRQAILRIATRTLVRPGRTLILAHSVKQYRSAPQPPKAAENMRDQIFYLLSADRRGPEAAESDLPIVLQIPPRFALSLTWLESESAAPAAQPPDRATPPPAPAPDDLAELQKAAGQMKGAPGAVVQTLGLALTVKTQVQFEVAEEGGYVAGIHRDSDETMSPYNFLVNQTWSGVKFSAQLEQMPQSLSADLALRLADPPQYDDALGKLPSLRAGAPEKEARDYHFQVAGQTEADFAAVLSLQPGQTRLLPLSWHTRGIATSQNARLRPVAVTLEEPPAPAAETPPQGGAPGATVHP